MNEDRFAYWALAAQLVVSLVVIVLSFWLIFEPTEPAVNTVAGNLIFFITGAWIGRGIDFAIGRKR